MSHTMQQNPDGSWSPAEPIGWQEEHGWFARLVFWIRGIEHCNDREAVPNGYRSREEYDRVSSELRAASTRLGDRKPRFDNGDEASR